MEEQVKFYNLPQIGYYLLSIDFPIGDNAATYLKDDILENLEDDEYEDIYFGDYIDSNATFEVIMECLESNALKRKPDVRHLIRNFRKFESSICMGIDKFTEHLNMFDPSEPVESDEKYGERYIVYADGETLGDRVRALAEEANCSIEEIAIGADDTGDYIDQALSAANDILKFLQIIKGDAADIVIQLILKSGTIERANDCLKRLLLL